MSNLQIATLTRTQDYSPIKQNEDNKGYIQQNTIGHEQKKEIEHHTKEVRRSDNADGQNKKFDAREKGSNEYQGDGGRKKRQSPEEGRVVIKGQKGFDMKV